MACCIALCRDGIFLSVLLRYLCEHTNGNHVADVMGLLVFCSRVSYEYPLPYPNPPLIALMGSLKALFESYLSIHEDKLPHELDMTLMTKLFTLLLKCEHYVVCLC